MRVTSYNSTYNCAKPQTNMQKSFGALSINPMRIAQVPTSENQLLEEMQNTNIATTITNAIKNAPISKEISEAIKSSKVLQELGKKYDVLATVIRKPESIKTMQNIRWFDSLKLEFVDKSKKLKVYNLDQRLEVGLKDAQNCMKTGEPDLTDVTSEDLRNIPFKSYESEYNKEIYKILCKKGLEKSAKNNFYEDVLKDSISKLDTKEIEKEIA